MPYCIIATVGQSVLTNDSTIREALNQFRKEEHDLKAIRDGKHDFPGKRLYDVVMASLQAKSGDEEWLRRASAELNHLVPVLAQQPPDRNDIIHLLASQTPDGVLAARVLKDFCEALLRLRSIAQSSRRDFHTHHQPDRRLQGGGTLPHLDRHVGKRY